MYPCLAWVRQIPPVNCTRPLSLPEMIILRRVLKPRLIATFVAIVGVGIIFTGYLFNLVL